MKNMINKGLSFEKRLETLESVDLDDRRYVKLGSLIMGAGLGIFLVWAAFAPLDQGVPGQGVVTVINKRMVVQHPSGGLVEEVLVTEGSKVRAGQVIARLNITENKAQAEMVRTQYRAAKSEEQRILAGLSGKKIIPPASGEPADPLMSEAMSYQAAVLQSRRAVLTSELAIMRENLRGLEHQADSYRTLSETRRQQSELAKQQVMSVRELSIAGYYPKNRLLELERTAAEHDAKADETRAELGRIESGIAEVKHKLLLRQQEYEREEETRLAELRQQVIGLKSKLDAAEFIENSSIIVSPADGVAVGLNFHGKGEVIPPGGRIVDIVPENEQLIIEAKFAPDTADDLRTGLKVDIRFPGLSHVNLPAIEGEVLTVSADHLVDEASRMSYFLVRVQLTKQGLATLNVHEAAIQPGMPAEVLVKTGERTLLNYLIAPVRDRMEWAFIQK